MVFSQLKTEILKELYKADKLSAQEIKSRLSRRYDSGFIRRKLRKLLLKQKIKRVHEKWHKPYQEYTLVPAVRKYLQKRMLQ